MKYKIVRENKPTLKNYGRYKAVAMHFQTIDAEQVAQEVQDNCSAKRSDVELVLGELLEVLARHLKQGDRVRLKYIGLMKLELDSEKVDSPKDFDPAKHIRGVRLHLLPESRRGRKELYEDISLEKFKG
jgi:hypothetical protein